MMRKIIIEKFSVTAILLAMSICGLSQSAFSLYEISEGTGGFSGSLSGGDNFGYSVAVLNDFDGDGNNELAVGAIGDDGPLDTLENTGAVWILFMDDEGLVKKQRKLTMLDIKDSLVFGGEEFGTVASIGDVDGNGVCDIAVGARTADGEWGLTYKDKDYRPKAGTVWIVTLEADASVKSAFPLSEFYFGNQVGYPVIGTDSRFGASVASLGVSDGNSAELLIGYPNYDVPKGGGIVFVSLNTQTIKEMDGFFAYGSFTGGADLNEFRHSLYSFTGINNNSNPPADADDLFDEHFHFGEEVASMGDVDGDGIADMAVHAMRDSVEDRKLFKGLLYKNREHANGAVFILFMNADKTIREYQKLSYSERSLDTLDLMPGTLFGDGIASMGDIDGDAVPDLLVSCSQQNDEGTNDGTLMILFLKPDGTIKDHLAIDRTNAPFAHEDNLYLGEGIHKLGDINHDGLADFAVSAQIGGKGGFYVLSYKAFRVDGKLPLADGLSGTFTIEVLQKSDSSVVLSNQSDTTGKFQFMIDKEGEYLIRAVPDSSLAEVYDSSSYPGSISIDSHIYNLQFSLIKNKPDTLTALPELLPHKLRFFPSPVHDLLFVEGDTKDIIKITLYNSAGKDVNASISIQDKTITVDTQWLPAGIYFSAITCKNGTRLTECFVKE